MIVTVDEVKVHLRIQHDEEDGYIGSLIAQAQAAAEDYCRVQFSEPAPEPVRLAVLLMVSHFYENRDNPGHQTSIPIRRSAASAAACSASFLLCPMPEAITLELSKTSIQNVLS